ncbi:MAG: TrkA family potassium uptake protein [Lachnospiraceae bacterium]|nr:TrkA family potassium uptake protein [Lachnospiraceae bacterium]
MNKQYAVFGLGSFGTSVALTLDSFGCDVIAVDKSQERIQEIADNVSYAVCADLVNSDAILNLGLKHIDVAVVATSESLEVSILATIISKELGIPHVIAKATDELHATILRKVGADAIVFPERDMGNWLAKKLVSKSYTDWIELSDEYSLAHISTPNRWSGKTLTELGVREKYAVNVVGILLNKDLDIKVDPNEPLPHGSTLVVVGSNSSLKILKEME